MYWSPRDARLLIKNEQSVQEKFANGISGMIHSKMDTADFKTPNVLYSMEWLATRYFMAGMGYGQVALSNPNLKEKCILELDYCIQMMMSEEVKQFDKLTWDNEDPLKSLDKTRGHVAYLGYLNLLLCMQQMLDKNSVYADLNDSITNALSICFEASPIGLVETYPCCKDALFFDGNVSQAYLPEKNWINDGGAFGVMVGVTE